MAGGTRFNRASAARDPLAHGQRICATARGRVYDEHPRIREAPSAPKPLAKHRLHHAHLGAYEHPRGEVHAVPAPRRGRTRRQELLVDSRVRLGIEFGLAQQFGEHPVSRSAFARALLEELDALYREFIEEGYAPVRKAWLEKSRLEGAYVTVTDGGSSRSGRVRGIDEYGALILESGEQILSGDVVIA